MPIQKANKYRSI